MQLCRKDEDKLIIQALASEIVIINNCINEALNGLDIWDFEIRIGYSREQAMKLLENLNSIIDQSLDIQQGSLIDDNWLLCPYCIDGVESSSKAFIVCCPNCKKKFYNPRCGQLESD